MALITLAGIANQTLDSREFALLARLGLGVQPPCTATTCAALLTTSAWLELVDQSKRESPRHAPQAWEYGGRQPRWKLAGQSRWTLAVQSRREYVCQS